MILSLQADFLQKLEPIAIAVQPDAKPSNVQSNAFLECPRGIWQPCVGSCDFMCFFRARLLLLLCFCWRMSVGMMSTCSAKSDASASCSRILEAWG